MKKLVILASILLILIIVCASIFVVFKPSENTGEYPGDPAYNKINYTNQPVTVLGKSEWTEVILDRLKLSTSRINSIGSIDELLNIDKKDMLLIDGFWIDSSNVSIQKLTNALTSVFLDGIPVLMIGQTPNILYAAIDEHITGVKQLPVSIDSEQYIYPSTIGMIFDEKSSSLNTYLSFDPYTKYGIEYRVTVLYNWGESNM